MKMMRPLYLSIKINNTNLRSQHQRKFSITTLITLRRVVLAQQSKVAKQILYHLQTKEATSKRNLDS